MKYLKRILALPFFAGIGLVSLIFVWFKEIYFFLKYGGEWIHYDKEINYETISNAITIIKEIKTP